MPARGVIMPNARKSSSSPRESAQMQALRFSADVMRALAHPLRLRIIAFIDGVGEACVSDIHNGLKIEQSLVSQHLRILRQAQLVNTVRRGKFVYYLLRYDLLERASGIAQTIALPTPPPGE